MPIMPTDDERIQVEILGETFMVKGKATNEEIRRTSDYLREQLNIMKGRHPSLTAKKLAVLTAFYLTDELLRVRKDYEALISILDKS